MESPSLFFFAASAPYRSPSCVYSRPQLYNSHLPLATLYMLYMQHDPICSVCGTERREYKVQQWRRLSTAVTATHILTRRRRRDRFRLFVFQRNADKNACICSGSAISWLAFPPAAHICKIPYLYIYIYAYKAAFLSIMHNDAQYTYT